MEITDVTYSSQVSVDMNCMSGYDLIGLMHLRLHPQYVASGGNNLEITIIIIFFQRCEQSLLFMVVSF